jgi:hypothetical protein
MIPNVHVTLKGKENTIECTSDKKGHIEFGKIPDDTYEIIVEKVGYETYKSEPVRVFDNSTLHFNVSLEKASRDIEVVVKPSRVEQALVTISAVDENLIHEPDVISITRTLDGEEKVTFEDIPYGKYEISVTDADGFKDFNTSITINKSNKNPRLVQAKLKPEGKKKKTKKEKNE